MKEDQLKWYTRRDNLNLKALEKLPRRFDTPFVLMLVIYTHANPISTSVFLLRLYVGGEEISAEFFFLENKILLALFGSLLRRLM